MGLARSGKHSDVLTANDPKRSQVVAALGQPDAVCASHSQGHCWRELYAVSGKYPNNPLSIDYANFDLSTLFIGEVVLTPVELVRSAYKSVTSGSFGVVYCGGGKDESDPLLMDYETYASSQLDGAASEPCAERETWDEGIP